MKQVLIFLLTLCTMFYSHSKTVYFINNKSYKHQHFFYKSNFCRDEISKPFCVLREELEKSGYHVKFSYDGKNLQDDFFALISINEINNEILNNIVSYPRERCFLLAFDPPIVVPQAYDRPYSAPFGKIFVMFDDLIDNVNYFKFHFPQPRLKMVEEIPPFEKKKFSVLIACNRNYGAENNPQALYPERKKIIGFFEKLPREEFDLYGLFWKGYRNWNGPITHKWPVLKNYKFTFCYENTKDQLGYITEKIFDSFVAGCVPVYKGATNITSYIPKECFIDRNDFSSEEDLYIFLKQMDKHTYEKYIQAIREYLDSPQAQLFSIDQFVQLMKKNLSEL